jgi:predicted RNA-binding protein YlxR (DUF448 family)
VSRAPERTCIGCRRTRPKAELVRLVRAGDGRVAVDGDGCAAGRGAYVCAALECVTKALAKGRLEHAFRRPCTRPAGGAESLLAEAGRRGEGGAS